MKQGTLSLRVEDEFQVLEVSMSHHEDQACSKDDMGDCLDDESI